MNIKTFVFLLIIILPCSCKSVAEPIRPNCLLKISISRGDSLWQSVISGHEEQEAAKQIKAEFPSKVKLEYPKILDKYRAGQKPLFGIDTVRRRAIIHAGYFSDLQRVDATRAMPKMFLLVGKLLKPSFMPPRQVVLFLLESQIIETYWHLESELCLDREDVGDIYTAHFTGIHRYCTNSCEQDPLNFLVRINAKTGEISAGLD
ncbi:MAG: hypothetical protein HQM16_09470 [Deltaproteobacteria bacterium]|nr:hypothetical protein [Deltaproteobacteria bacterium]